jgi:hypothetical protein
MYEVLTLATVAAILTSMTLTLPSQMTAWSTGGSVRSSAQHCGDCVHVFKWTVGRLPTELSVVPGQVLSAIQLDAVGIPVGISSTLRSALPSVALTVSAGPSAGSPSGTVSKTENQKSKYGKVA